MVFTKNEHIHIVKNSRELEDTIDEIGAYRRNLRMKGAVSSEKEYPLETIQLCPTNVDEPIVWEFHQVVPRLHVECHTAQGKVRLHLVASELLRALLEVKFTGTFEFTDMEDLKISGPCVFVAPMPLVTDEGQIGEGVELRVDPRIMAGDNPMLYCLIEDMVDEQNRDDEDDGYDCDEDDE